MEANPFEAIIANAGKAGWEWFEQAPAAVREQLEISQTRNVEDGKAIARAWARFARSPDGKKALEALFDKTLRRTVFFTQLGLDPASMANWGAFREGQNALAHEIARQIGLGNAEKVKPRDV